MADPRFSQNKANYFTLDFDNITEKGLKKLIEAFGKNKQKVAEVEATNRIVRKDRLATKKFLLRFEKGQSITVTVGDQGDIVETRLNSTVLPVKSLNTMDAYAKEVSGKVVSNQLRWDKSVARKVIKKVVPTDTDKKPAGKSIQARLIQAKAANATAQANVTAIQGRLNELQSRQATSTAELDAMRKKLDAERATTNDLIQQIESLGGTA